MGLVIFGWIGIRLSVEGSKAETSLPLLITYVESHGNIKTDSKEALKLECYLLSV